MGIDLGGLLSAGLDVGTQAVSAYDRAVQQRTANALAAQRQQALDRLKAAVQNAQIGASNAQAKAANALAAQRLRAPVAKPDAWQNVPGAIPGTQANQEGQVRVLPGIKLAPKTPKAAVGPNMNEVRNQVATEIGRLTSPGKDAFRNPIPGLSPQDAAAKAWGDQIAAGLDPMLAPPAYRGAPAPTGGASGGGSTPVPPAMQEIIGQARAMGLTKQQTMAELQRLGFNLDTGEMSPKP